MSSLPDKNTDYSKVDYWNERYVSEETFEWCKDYTAFKHLLLKEILPTDRILMLGCGNSRLSEEMYRDGFHSITNIDYSPVVIENMKNRSPEAQAMRWLVMDITDLKFPNASFDVVIEKATLDALLVHERDPWRLSQESDRLMERILTQVSHVLTPDNGRFISITFAQPHFRKQLYCRAQYDWGDLRTATFGDGFHFYLYVLTRGQPLADVLAPLTQPHIESQQAVTFVEDESYLNDIEM